jgi:hypothetical protein
MIKKPATAVVDSGDSSSTKTYKQSLNFHFLFSKTKLCRLLHVSIVIADVASFHSQKISKRWWVGPTISEIYYRLLIDVMLSKIFKVDTTIAKLIY